MGGYTDWFSAGEKMLRNYSKSLGIKNHHSALTCPSTDERPDPYAAGSDFATLEALIVRLDSAKFQFIKETEQGKGLLRLIEMTRAAIQSF